VDAIDRAGNVSTAATRSFVVDRVRPTILATTPAANSRMVDPLLCSVSFSESMNTSQPGITGNIEGGSWDGSQTTWTSVRLMGIGIHIVAVNSAVQDLAGNAPASFPSWQFHTAPRIPASGTRLSYSVQKFDASNDVDGQVFVAYAETVSPRSVRTLLLDGASGFFLLHPVFLPASVYGDIYVQVSSYVQPSMYMLRTVSVNSRDLNSGAFVRRLSIDNGAVFDPSGLPVVSPPIEPADGSSAVGLLVGQTYARNPVMSSLAYQHEKVIPGARQWAAFSYDGTNLVASHRRCGNDIGGNRNCIFEEGAIADVVQPSVLSSLSGAVSDSGCLIYSYDAGAGRRARVLSTPSSAIGSVSGLTFNSVPAPGEGFSVANRTGGGHWGAWVSGGLVQVSRTTNPAMCTSGSLSTNWTSHGTVDTGGSRNFRVVQLGSRPAVVYLSSAGELRIVYP